MRAVFYVLAGLALGCAMAALYLASPWSPYSIIQVQPVVAAFCVAGTLFAGSAVMVEGGRPCSDTKDS